MTYELWRGDCRACLNAMFDDSVDSVICDPPYELGFMGKSWDASGVAYDVDLWREVFRVLKPGGHLLAFGGSRTAHRLAVAIEDAGFEIRDGLIWLYGSGFPKSLDVSKAIDKAAGAERTETRGPHPWAGRNGADGANAVFGGQTHAQEITAPATPEAQQWEGWGTALKPAHEPIVMARKPLIGTVAANVLAHGVGGLNIDACRVPADGGRPNRERRHDAALDESRNAFGAGLHGSKAVGETTQGRFPANVLHDGSDPVLAVFPHTQSNSGNLTHKSGAQGVAFGKYGATPTTGITDSGSAARFFYCAKASKADRDAGCGELAEHTDETHAHGMSLERWPDGSLRPRVKPPAARRNTHPTVKPTALMRWLVRLVTPPGGLVFDPFTGSGSTGKAAILEGFRFLGAELTPEYWPIAKARLDHAVNERHTAQL